jgi:hypothetical protein
MSDPRPLMEVPPAPALFTFAADTTTASEALWGWREAGLTAFRVRGRKMRTVDDLFDEMAAALQFPDYFGENWPAFDECLSDLDWLPRAVGIVVLIDDPLAVLSDEPDDLPALIRAFVSAMETFAKPVTLGEWWDRPALPFHVVLHCQEDEVAETTRRWVEAGAPLKPFPG